MVRGQAVVHEVVAAHEVLPVDVASDPDREVVVVLELNMMDVGDPSNMEDKIRYLR